MQIVQVLRDTGQVAAMPSAGCGTVEPRLIVGWISIGKAVDHNQVKNVC